VAAGAEVVIEHDARPIAVVRPAITGRLISESIAIAEARAKEFGSSTPDPDFAADLKRSSIAIENLSIPPTWD